MSNEELRLKNGSICNRQTISEIAPISSDYKTREATSNKNQPIKRTSRSNDEAESQSRPKSDSKRIRKASSSDDDDTNDNNQPKKRTIRPNEGQSVNKESQPMTKIDSKRTRETSPSDNQPKKRTIRSNDELKSQQMPKSNRKRTREDSPSDNQPKKRRIKSIDEPKSQPIQKSDSKRTREASSSDDDTNDNNQPKKRTNRSNDELKSQPIPKSESKRTRETISSDDEEQPKRKRLEKKVEEKPIKSDDRLSIRGAWMAYLSEERTSATTSNRRGEKRVPRADLKASMSDYVPRARENVGRKRPFSSCEQDNDEKRRVEAEMIRARWDVRSLADPNVNLTVSNYRKRVFGDSGLPTRREFLKDVPLAEKPLETSEREDELLKRDMQSLSERIEIINEKYDQAKLKYERDNRDHNYNECYNYNRNVLKQLEASRQSEIDSFKELFKSGEYKRGTFHEYKTLEIYQPSAKRRKYDDDGFRRAILPQWLIDSIHVENELYQRYYNKPN